MHAETASVTTISVTSPHTQPPVITCSHQMGLPSVDSVTSVTWLIYFNVIINSTACIFIWFMLTIHCFELQNSFLFWSHNTIHPSLTSCSPYKKLGVLSKINEYDLNIPLKKKSDGLPKYRENLSSEPHVNKMPGIVVICKYRHDRTSVNHFSWNSSKIWLIISL